jgi:copper(I)-binding protein
MNGIRAAGFLLCCVIATGACAQVNVMMPWVRGSAAGQKSTGAFMQLEAHAAGDVALVAARTPLARSVEIREARREGTVTRLHKSERLEIAAGSRLDMKPGRSHLLLVGPLRPIKEGEWVPITLEFETRDARRFTVEVRAEAMSRNAREHWHKH